MHKCSKCKKEVGASDTQRYKTLGNGVVVNVVCEIIKKIQ